MLVDPRFYNLEPKTKTLETRLSNKQVIQIIRNAAEAKKFCYWDCANWIQDCIDYLQKFPRNITKYLQNKAGIPRKLVNNPVKKNEKIKGTREQF